MGYAFLDHTVPEGQNFSKNAQRLTPIVFKRAHQPD